MLDLGEERYVSTARGARVFKTPRYFLMELEPGAEAGSGDGELDALRWISFDEALEPLAHEGARAAVRRVRDRLERG